MNTSDMNGGKAMAQGGICCFSGYRPHRFAFSQDGLRPEHVQIALGQQIARLYADGYRTFISGMCIGVDLWAAAEVVRLRRQYQDIQLVAAVPFKGQDVYWKTADKREYNRLLSQCQHVEILSEPPNSQAASTACYRRRNMWMVEMADTVLAVFADGQSDVRSGTAATLRYARRLHRRLITIHPVTLAVTEEDSFQMQFEML